MFVFSQKGVTCASKTTDSFRNCKKQEKERRGRTFMFEKCCINCLYYQIANHSCHKNCHQIVCQNLYAVYSHFLFLFFQVPRPGTTPDSPDACYISRHWLSLRNLMLNPGTKICCRISLNVSIQLLNNSSIISISVFCVWCTSNIYNENYLMLFT